MRILKIDAIQELIAVRIVNTMRQSVVTENTELVAEPFLNADEPTVVVGVSAAIGLHNAGIVFAEIRVGEIELTPLIEVSGCGAGAGSAGDGAIAWDI